MKKIEIDLTDPTLPDNYMQVRAALERDCEKHARQMESQKTAQQSYQAGRKVAKERCQQGRTNGRGQTSFFFRGKGR